MKPFPGGTGGASSSLGPCWQGEGLLGQRCQVLAGYKGGWARQAPGNRNCLDTRGGLWSIFRVWFCLFHLEAGGVGQVGREEKACWWVPEGPGLTPTGRLPLCDRFFRR